MQQRPWRYQWTHVKKSAASLEDEVRDADRVIVIDGCHDCCATKKLVGTTISPHGHIVATDLGIEKKGKAEVQFAEIERVVAAVHNTMPEE